MSSETITRNDLTNILNEVLYAIGVFIGMLLTCLIVAGRED